MSHSGKMLWLKRQYLPLLWSLHTAHGTVKWFDDVEAESGLDYFFQRVGNWQ